MMKKIIVVLTILSLITLQHYAEITRFFESVWQGDGFNPTLYANVELKYKETTVFLLTLTNAALPDASSQKQSIEADAGPFQLLFEIQMGLHTPQIPNENISKHSLQATSRIAC